MLEKFGLIAKKFLFPVIIIIAGLLVVIKGVSADAILSITNETVSVPKTTKPATKGLRRHRLTRSCHPGLQAPQTPV